MTFEIITIVPYSKQVQFENMCKIYYNNITRDDLKYIDLVDFLQAIPQENNKDRLLACVFWKRYVAQWKTLHS